MRTLSLAATLALTLLAACTGGDPIDCPTLDVDACDAEPECVAIDATPAVVANVDPNDPSSESCYEATGPAEPVGCQAIDLACDDIMLLGAPDDASSDPWVFPNSCLPEGWSEGASLGQCPS